MKNLHMVIGRMNPPTVGHKRLIDAALSSGERVLLLLGGNGNINQNNPLTFLQRKNIILNEYQEKRGQLSIDEILDTPNDKQWVKNISHLVKGLGDFSCIFIYIGDPENDSSVQAIEQYKDIFPQKLEFVVIDRYNSSISYKNKQIEISATNLRDAMNSGESELVEKLSL